MIEKMVVAAWLAIGSAGAVEASEMVACLAGLRQHYAAIDACFSVKGGALIRASAEPAETIAAAVDAACRPAQAAMAQDLLRCMRPDQANDVVRRYISEQRKQVIAATVMYRAGGR